MKTVSQVSEVTRYQAGQLGSAVEVVMWSDYYKLLLLSYKLEDRADALECELHGEY